MDINDIKSEIFFLIENIKNQTHLSLDNQSKISQIEIDLIMTKIQNLYDKFCDLNIKNKALNKDSHITESQKIKASEDKKQTLIDNIIAEKQRHKMEEEVKVQYEKTNNIISGEKIENVQVEEKIIQDEENKIEIPTENENVPIKEIIPKKESKKKFEKEPEKIKPEKQVDLFSDYRPPIADTLKSEHKSLLEKITEEIEDNSIVTKLQNDKINDLKSAIGINEKFLFINDLFNGSMQEYYNSIIKLNDFENFEKAMEYFNELKEIYSWDSNSDAFKLLNNLIKRRY
ncbi:MAG: hypothetical protein J7J86_08000 [Bacteroidales bacterium]|nr:hypothetical protein [Bacteroidales bacterium]